MAATPDEGPGHDGRREAQGVPAAPWQDVGGGTAEHADHPVARTPTRSQPEGVTA